ncbi:unnamed protein product [Cuscuta epithymum]|uniref:Amino acid transporter transmembrane domain-containing protein n=1 Tax=Cuscuta epithymum TaxID=186058 RepID=A0AAV0DE75_9ASTE|nr:unnamed protein product [Cuscuta epithymum]CAH9124052.1 unnamed protein product [Cuscuta epithymum]
MAIEEGCNKEEIRTSLLGGTHDKGQNGASFLGSVFNLSSTVVGAGIMALPATIKVLGIGLGISTIIFMAVLTNFSIDILLRFSGSNNNSYASVMGDAFGNWGRRLLQVCVLVNNIGILVVYMIIIGDVLSGTSSDGVHHAGVLEGWFGEQWWTGRHFLLLVITLLVFAPLAFCKRIDSLRHTSALAVALAVVFLIITAGITIYKLFTGGIKMPRFLPNVTDITSFWRLFTVVPVIVTAYICHFNVHSIENEMKDPHRIRSVVRASLAICCIIYIMTSLFGYLLFGDSTLDDVLANFNSDLGVPFSHVLSDAVRISYALHLMLVFPVLFYPLRVNVDGLFFPSARALESAKWRFASINLGLIIVVFVIANFVPSIWDAFQFSGATATVSLAFILPAAIALKNVPGIATKEDKILSIFMIVLAVASNAVAIYSDAYAVFNTNSSPDK